MTRTSFASREFATRLVDEEAKADNAADSETAVFRVCEKLGATLATFMGTIGFRALLSRALNLASREVLWLKELHGAPDGSLEGLKEVSARVEAKEMARGGVVLVTQLIALMAAFIGEDLAVRLVREAWPQVSLEDLPPGQKGKNEKAK